ncbi:MAG: SsrA-binding protein SmpB [Clostridia bacterium]|nr:SsrA-binding protein SmpB [Clostridia bacterium]
MKDNKAIKTVAVNRKAYHDYHILETMEAGIQLFGTEVKSIRGGNLNLKDSYINVHNNEIYIYNMHISPFEHGNIFNKDPLRPRKLLMHRGEILKLQIKCKQDGLTMIPLSVYFNHGLIKLEIAVAKGKKLYDKRDDIAARDAEREMQRASSVKY